MLRARLTTAACLLVAACGLSQTGTGEDLTSLSDGGGPPSSEAGATTVDGGVPGAPDAAASTCGRDAAGVGANGSMCAPKAATAPNVDGDLSDWSSVPFFHLDSKSAGQKTGTVSISGDFALQWTADAIYFAAKVTDAKLQGSDGTDPYNNSAVELYLDGDHKAQGKFQADDHQYIVDYRGLAKEYDNSSARTPPAGFASKAVVGGGGYVVEMKVPANVLGHTTLGPMKMGLDVELDQNLTGSESGVLIYYMKAAPPDCGGCNCSSEQPSCNTYLFGEVVLVP